MAFHVDALFLGRLFGQPGKPAVRRPKVREVQVAGTGGDPPGQPP
jgi:hypothetical protein